MAHVIIKGRVPNGILFCCECGRVLAWLPGPPFHTEHYEAIGQAHREHVRMALEVPWPWRLGSNPNPAVREHEIREEAGLPPWVDLERVKDELLRISAMEP